MKKLVSILLLALYGFSVSGASVQLHYCCGKVAGIAVGFEQERHCEHAGDYDMPGCCYDQELHMDVDEDQGAASPGGLPAPMLQLAEMPVLSWEYTVPATSSIQSQTEARGSPPPLSPIPLYLRNQVFRN
ncbi:MAG: hypothetical protein MUF29_09920 [Chitinophagaceae bacterium]|nr:hypothetical protein [Chitinophagaceae bacterium]